jgi:anti-anti-sigma factor
VVTSAIAVSVDLPSSSVRVGGELDRNTAHHLLEAVEMLTTRSSRRWRLDAAGVTFCDAGGLRALTDAQAYAAAHGRILRVVRSSRSVDRLVQLLEDDQAFPQLQPAARRIRTGAPAGRAPHPRCGATGTA